MSKAVFGLIIYGLPSPFDTNNPAPVLWTDGELPTSGRPSELIGATILPRVAKRPGLNWGADLRTPVGSGGELTITLIDDNEGALGQLFLQDPDADFWGLEANRLSASDTDDIKIVGSPTPSDGLYFLGNECVDVERTASTSGSPPTHTLDLVRGRCGSTAQTHFLRPSRFSAGEDGSQDRIFLTSKPNWDEGFYCGIYLFLLDQFGAISETILRRGVIVGEPTPVDRPFYEVKARLLEDKLSEHKIGEISKEITLIHPVRVMGFTAGRASTIEILLPARDAADYFNEPLIPRGSTLLSESAVSNLNTRLRGDSKSTYEIALHVDQEWIYTLTRVEVFSSITATGGVLKKIKLCGTLLEPTGYAPGSTIVQNPNSSQARLKPWFQNRITQGAGQGLANGSTTEGDPPRITLRLKMRKTVVQAFLQLACSVDGSSGGTFDKLIGGVGAGVPASFFNTGTTHGGSAVQIPGNTSIMLQLDQLLNPINTYYFDLSKGISLRDFLTNEFIASQLLLGSLQNGKLALKSWVHEVAATTTLNPYLHPVKPGKRLAAVKRLDLSARTRVLDLEPQDHRQVRWFGASNIQPDEVQPIRFWRDGVNLSVTDIQSGDLAQLVRAFHRLFGGAPRVYEVPISIEDYAAEGIEFGDAVNWSDSTIPTSAGVGISGQFIVIGVDLDYDTGTCNLLLLQNSLYASTVPPRAGYIAPALAIHSVTPIDATHVDVVVKPIATTAWDPNADLGAGLPDFGGIFKDIKDNRSYIKVFNLMQAPLGEKEAIGALESHAKITEIVQEDVGELITFTLEVESAYIRGSQVAAVEDLFVVGDTHLLLPARAPADTNLSNALIEAESKAGPSEKDFLSYQPTKSLTNVTHTFKVGA